MADLRDNIAQILLSEEQIKAKVSEMAAKISEDYKDKKLLLVGILKGSMVFMADLMRFLDINAKIDFMSVSSYGSSTVSSGQVRIIMDLKSRSRTMTFCLWRIYSTAAQRFRTLRKYFLQGSRGAYALPRCLTSRRAGKPISPPITGALKYPTSLLSATGLISTRITVPSFHRCTQAGSVFLNILSAPFHVSKDTSSYFYRRLYNNHPVRTVGAIGVIFCYSHRQNPASEVPGKQIFIITAKTIPRNRKNAPTTRKHFVCPGFFRRVSRMLSQ